MKGTEQDVHGDSSDHEHDSLKAASLLRNSLDKEDSPAAHSLGLVLVNRPDFATNPNEGVDLVERSAGWVLESALTLGLLYRDGKQVPQGFTKSYLLSEVAPLEDEDSARARVQGSLPILEMHLPEVEKLSLIRAARL